MSSWAVWAILIVIIMLIMVARARLASPEELLNQSSGIMDAPAVAAAGALRNARGPRDLVTRADIRNLNWVGAMSAEEVGADADDVRRAIDASLVDWTRALELLAGGADDENPLELVQRIDNFNPLIFPHGAAEFQDFVTEYNAAVPEIYRRETERRRAAVTADNHHDGSKQLLEEASTVRSDPQNVHDSTVNAALRGTLLRIRRADVNPDLAMLECRRYIESVRDAERRNKALRALGAISRDHIYTFGDREDNIFAQVWARASDPRNADNANNIREAVVDALASSIEGESTVCINGRASRVLSALTLLDHDNSIANPKTLDMYRQQIFGEISAMISAETKEIASTDNPLSLSAQKYRGDDVAADDRDFAAHLDNKIEEHIRTYAGELAPNDLERLVAECRGAI